MNGVILQDAEIVRAMEQNLAGRFIPVTQKKNGELSKSGALLTESAMQLVMRYVKRLIATMAQTLAAGDVAADPLMKNRNACDWCPYKAVCGSERMGETAEKLTMKNEEVLAHMEAELGGDAHGRTMD